MKLAAIMVLACTFHSFSMGFAQKVDLSLKNASVDRFFREIHNQTGYQYMYEDDLFDKSFKVTINAKQIPLEEALDKALGGQNVSYAIVDNAIIVTTKTTHTDVMEAVIQPGSSIRLRGVVVDSEGETLPGVTVIVKGTTIGGITNLDGEFDFAAPASSEALLTSMVGKETLETKISADINYYRIVLAYQMSLLDEVQIIAYGTTTRRLSTSSVSSVSSEAIERQSLVNPLQALQGSASGLFLTNTAGSIGAMPTIQIRGVSTLNTGVAVATQPLFIVDGAIIPGSGVVASSSSGATNATLGTYWGQEGGVNPFNFLNPNDIESIEVLKDADATSIYGSRGTNGVIIITTKKGRAGATRFNVDFSTGFTQASYIPSRLNTAQYLEMRADAFAMGNPTAASAINPIVATAANAPDLLVWPQDAYFDWSGFEYGNSAKNTNVQANMSGGTKDLNFLASFGYSRNEDFTRGDPYQQRFSGLLNLNHTSKNERFNITLSNNISSDRMKPSTATLIFPATLRGFAPNMPLVNTDGTPFWPTNAIAANPQSFITNPFAGDFINTLAETFSFINSANASYKLTDFLTLRVQTGYTNQLNKTFTTIPSTSINPFVAGAFTPRRTESESKFETINIEPQVIFATNIGKGSLNALVGTTFFERNTTTFGIEIDGYDSDVLLGTWSAGTTISNRRSTFFKYRFNSVFARANYTHDNKYLINATYRRDGSSRFGSENRWANFASLGLGWIFSNENFLKDNPILSYGKLKGSYGTTGNDIIQDFRFTSLFTSSGVVYGNLIGLAPDFLSVPGFKWENTTKLDFALELGFLKERFYLQVNWFRNLSTDLLVSQRVPSQTGFGSYLGNFPGVIENKGWEFELTSNNLAPSSKIKWKTKFNLSLLKNTLLEYPDLENSPNSTRFRVGEAIPNPAFPSNLVRTLIFEGVDPNTGLPIYRDINGDGIISTAGNNDRDFVGSTFPKYYGGINNSFSFKGFSLDIFIHFARQLTTNHLYLASTVGQLYNPISDLYGNYWKAVGQEAKYPRLWSGVGAQNALLSNFYSSSAVIDEVFYAKVRSVSLSYTLPKSLLQGTGLGEIRVYARGQNLFTHTSKELFKDPEAMNPRGLSPQTFIFGVNVSF